MRWGLLAIAGIAACSSGQGVDVEVHAPDGVTFDSVQLFITYDVCRTQPDGDPCPAIGWPQLPQGATPVEGDVFVTKQEYELVVKSTVLEDGNGVIHLEAAPGYEDTLAIAVVAFNGSTPVAAEVLESKHIPLHDEEHWYVVLDAVDVASANMGPPADGKLDHRALSWAREPSPAVPDTTDYAGCFVFQDWDGSAWKTQYFVPDTDPDCDGVPPDCDPTWNHAPTSSARCLTHLETLPTVCAAGMQTCVDESAGMCKVAPVICAPSLLCECYDPASPPTSTELQTCVRDKLKDTTSSSIPGVYCPFVENPDNPGYACDLNNTNSGEHMNFTVPGNCVSVDPADPVAVLRPIGQPFSGGTTTISLATATINVHASSNGTECNVDLAWALQSLTPGSGQPLAVAINFGARQIIVPVFIDFKDNATLCPQGTTLCTKIGAWPSSQGGSDPADSMFLCTMPQ